MDLCPVVHLNNFERRIERLVALRLHVSLVMAATCLIGYGGYMSQWLWRLHVSVVMAATCLSGYGGYMSQWLWRLKPRRYDMSISTWISITLWF